MARIQSAWFEFNGRRSSELGLRLTDAHSFSRGEQRGAQEEISGRDGDLWFSDGAADAFEIKRSCLAPLSKLRQVAAWLSGSGGLRFSNEESAMYDARIVKKIDFRRAVPDADPLYKFDVSFLCQPLARLWPEAAPIEISASGTLLENPGSAPALPRIEIVGTGSFSLTIGMQTMFFAGVEGGILVDSELQDALTLDGAQLANDRIDGDFFEIQPGSNAVQWLEGGTDDEGAELPGRVEKLMITPRWRCL